MDQKHNDQLYVLNQVDLNSNMFNDIFLKRVAVQPTENPRSVGPYKSKSKTTMNKKKSHFKNKKFRSESTQLREGSTKPDNDTINKQ